MTDSELTEYLGLADCDPAKLARYFAAMSADKRAAYERMAHVEFALKLWDAGVGQKPAGVIVCKPKHCKASA